MVFKILVALWSASMVVRGDKTKLLIEHGFLLRDHGSVYLDTNDAYLSVFVNLAVPKFELEEMPEGCSKHFSCAQNGTRGRDCKKQEWSQVTINSQRAVNLATKRVEEHKNYLRFQIQEGKNEISWEFWA